VIFYSMNVTILSNLLLLEEDLLMNFLLQLAVCTLNVLYLLLAAFTWRRKFTKVLDIGKSGPFNITGILCIVSVSLRAL